MDQKLIMGTRGSKLALYQTEQVRKCLMEAFPELQVAVRVYKTLGDRKPDLNLLENQGKGVFCSELEDALLTKEIDMAVHSVKDLPGSLPTGLKLGGYLEREDPREVLVARDGMKLKDLPTGARIGTSSIRRLVQLRHLRPDLEFHPIRGNVETRVKKVMEGQYDATILALAGLRRLGLENYITQTFELDEVIPAPGQGCIAVEIRKTDAKVGSRLFQITDHAAAVTVRAERAFLGRMGGNCQSAYGAYAFLKAGYVELTGMYEEAGRIFVKRLRAPEEEAEILGICLAEELLAKVRI